MPIRAYAWSVIPGKEGELEAFVRERESRDAEYRGYRRQIGITREAVFLQRSPQGSQVITYRELSNTSTAQPNSKSSFEVWLNDRMGALYGFDPTTAPPAKVELLIRQRPPRPGKLYAAALPLLPNKTARLHEWAGELNGIHAEEFVESLRRLGFGLTLFIQYTPQVDLVISAVDGDDPANALGRLATSTHPFDRWHVQQIADQTGLDFSAPPPPPNVQLWSWDDTAALAGTKPLAVTNQGSE